MFRASRGGFSATYRFADDFTLAGPETINAIRFWGGYSPTDTPLSDDFTMIIYGNSGGLPDGSNVIATRLIGDPGRTDTGEDFDGGDQDIYVYEASFGDLALGTGTYWVSVFNNTATDPDDNWFWARHDFPGNDARSLDSGAIWLHEFSDSELAFQLWYPIPEPATLSLLALAPLVALRRRRR